MTSITSSLGGWRQKVSAKYLAAFVAVLVDLRQRLGLDPVAS